MDDSVIKKFLLPAQQQQQQQQNSLLPLLTVYNNANTNANSVAGTGLALLTPSKDEDSYSLLSSIHHQKERQYNMSNHLLELQKEIKEEEEEIFADINNLIDRGSHLFSNLVSDDDEEDAQKHLTQHHRNKSNEKQINHPINLHSNNGGVFRSTTTTAATNSEKDASSNDYQSHIVIDSNLQHTKFPPRHHFDSKFSDWDDEKMISSTTGDLTTSNAKDQHFQPIDATNKQSVDYMHDDDDDDDDPLYMPRRQNNNNNLDQDEDDEHNNYTDELTFASCSQVDQQDYQKLQAVIQQVTSNLPKPCVFFLEGNCRRIDCKYSHDLSNITCKYWIEGFCFKGELCPFLHSYTPNDAQDPSLIDEDGIDSLSKKKFYPTFVIESEADFPSLPLDAPISSLNDSSKSSNDTDTITTTIKNQILNSNPAVVFKTVKKRRKRG